MRCTICNKNIAELFLKKIKGTYIKDKKRTLRAICFECQKQFKTKEEIAKHLPL